MNGGVGTVRGLASELSSFSRFVAVLVGGSSSGGSKKKVVLDVTVFVLIVVEALASESYFTDGSTCGFDISLQPCQSRPRTVHQKAGHGRLNFKQSSVVRASQPQP